MKIKLDESIGFLVIDESSNDIMSNIDMDHKPFIISTPRSREVTYPNLRYFRYFFNRFKNKEMVSKIKDLKKILR